MGKCKLATASFGHGVATTLLQLAKGYSVISNGGYDVNPKLILRDLKKKKSKKTYFKQRCFRKDC